MIAGAIVIPVGTADAADAVALLKAEGREHRLVSCLHGHSRGSLNEARRIAPHTDLAVSVSRHGMDLLVSEAGLPAERVRHVPFGVPLVATSGSRKESASLRVAYVGRLEQSEKRVLDLIGIVDGMRDRPFELDIVGEGPERDRLERALALDVAAGRVRFRGYLESRALHEEIYARVDALLVLSPSEGGPITAWEAMAHGVVPVVSDFVGFRDEPIWREGANCLAFAVGNTAGACAALERLLDRGARAALSAEAREVPAAYRREAFACGWIEALRDAAAMPSRGADRRYAVPVSAGRLAALPRLRIALRRFARSAGRRYLDKDAGDEWPSTYG